jgi:tRNA pseudouridine38-40 synthase
VGTHDYRIFRAADDGRENTVRTIHAIEVIPGFGGHEELIAIQVRGSAFLKQMVRIIAGTLVDAGRGRLSAADVAALVGDAAKRDDAGPTAPAHGLTLVRVTLGRPAGASGLDDG